MLSFLKWYLSFSKLQENYKAKVNLLRAKEIKEKKLTKKLIRKRVEKGEKRQMKKRNK